ncbi:HAD hydrolase-like protein [Saccharibacillus sp. CPCC 101409]|uniref:HAD family hydrolase n=1 Tax=Saccharibacillus sp. CPCC 101409 TaxID=3058041 RepID=UPI00267223AB|nr:HAD family hydrolase [Saccharibacillus sp. CPCC 101409]MDO3408844.1 HAD hydrolase-like protein [Saccharibacillus sp. CPCC 101409]
MSTETKTTPTKLFKPQAMIFDMDGTLFQTETALLPAYHRMFDILRAEGLYSGDTPPQELILGSLGMLLEEIWKVVIPDASEEVRSRANDLLLELQLEVLEDGEALLYPDVKETLETLKERGVRLFVASNGLEGYVKGVADALGIAPLFESQYSAGEYQTATKVLLVELLLKTHGVESAWMVGDRSSDVQAGRGNGLGVIGCAYADFGANHELEDADVLITKFGQLIELYDEAERG